MSDTPSVYHTRKTETLYSVFKEIVAYWHGTVELGYQLSFRKGGGLLPGLYQLENVSVRSDVEVAADLVSVASRQINVAREPLMFW